MMMIFFYLLLGTYSHRKRKSLNYIKIYDDIVFEKLLFHHFINNKQQGEWIQRFLFHYLKDGILYFNVNDDDLNKRFPLLRGKSY